MSSLTTHPRQGVGPRPISPTSGVSLASVDVDQVDELGRRSSAGQPSPDALITSRGESSPASTPLACTPDTTATPASPGLVISAKSVRESGRGAFPSRDLVGVAAATLADTAGQSMWNGQEGPQWFVTIAPGMVKVGSVNLSKGQRSANREVDRTATNVALLAALAADYGTLPEPSESTPRIITAWSAKSRANMTRRLSTLDYNELDAAGHRALVTLTYPGEWLSVAPDGKAVKRHLHSFAKRWNRAFGSRPVMVWKLEFQRRGAPHFHLLTARPARIGARDFRAWVALTWAEIVAHPDPVEYSAHLRAGTRVDEPEARRMSDPRRIGVYFSKHGLFAAKDYQNQPPEEWAGGSIGRMWGYQGIVPSEVAAPVSPDQALDVARTLRRMNNRHRYLRPVTVVRVEQSTGRVRYRSARRPVHRMPGSRGFVVVNDGPSTALDVLDRVLAVALAPALPQDREQARRVYARLAPSRLPR